MKPAIVEIYAKIENFKGINMHVFILILLVEKDGDYVLVNL